MIVTPNTNVMQARASISSMSTFGARLRQARKMRKMSQQRLADLSGISQSAIGNYEAGSRHSSRVVVALATALQVRPEWLEQGHLPMLPQADAGDTIERRIQALPPALRARLLEELEDLEAAFATFPYAFSQPVDKARADEFHESLDRLTDRLRQERRKSKPEPIS